MISCGRGLNSYIIRTTSPYEGLTQDYE